MSSRIIDTQFENLKSSLDIIKYDIQLGYPATNVINALELTGKILTLIADWREQRVSMKRSPSGF